MSNMNLDEILSTMGATFYSELRTRGQTDEIEGFEIHVHGVPKSFQTSSILNVQSVHKILCIFLKFVLNSVRSAADRSINGPARTTNTDTEGIST